MDRSPRFYTQIAMKQTIYLKTGEDMVRYLEAYLEEAGDDAAFISKAFGAIARALGMSQLAKDTGLYNALKNDETN